MGSKLSKLISNQWFLVAVFAISAIGISFQKYQSSIPKENGIVTSEFKYNNFKIFKSSYEHLEKNENLYLLYDYEVFDLFKYSPSFAFSCVIFQPFNDLVGLIIWNLINHLVFAFAIIKLGLHRHKLFWVVFPFLLIESISSTQNSQSNLLVLGLLTLFVYYIDRAKPFSGMMAVFYSAFIKIFGLVLLPYVLFKPQLGKNVLFGLLSFVLLLCLPLIVVSPEQLLWQYENWWELLTNDHSASVGNSLLSLLQVVMGIDINKGIILLFGIIMFCIPLTRISLYKNKSFQYSFFISSLIWIILFNHKSEPPTYIIAVFAAALWFLSESPNKTTYIIFIFAMIFSSLYKTDLLPRWFANNVVKPYELMVLPMLVIWLITQYRLLFGKFDNDEVITYPSNIPA